MAITNLSEAAIQQSIVRWYQNTYCLQHHSPRCMIFSIPNEGLFEASNMSLPAHLRKVFKQFLKRLLFKLIGTGLYPGVGDLCVIHTYYCPCVHQWTNPYLTVTIFIEVKTPIGTQSPKQKSFEEHCRSMGIPYHVVRSLDEFKAIVGNL